MLGRAVMLPLLPARQSGALREVDGSDITSISGEGNLSPAHV